MLKKIGRREWILIWVVGLAALPIIATIVGTVVSGILINLLDYFTFFIIMGVSVMIICTTGFFLMKEGEGLQPNCDDKGFFIMHILEVILSIH